MLKHRFIVSSFAAGVAVLVTGTIALAVWTVTGSGTGGAAAAVAQNLTINEITPTGSAANLFPGGVSGVSFTVTNPNPYAVTITGLSYGTPTSSNTTSCSNANIAIDAAAPTTVSLSIPASGTSSTFTVLGVLDMLHSAPNGCQGVSFNVPITITAANQQ